jgi:hypothetical protein
MRYVVFLSAFTLSCGPLPPLCRGYCDRGNNIDGYTVDATWRDGLQVDAPTTYDTRELSALVDAIDDCLRDIGELPHQEAVAALCRFQRWVYQDHPLRRECVEVKVVNSWHWSHDFEYQLLYDEAPFESCAAKGFEAGPCYWRAAVQDGYRIIVPPGADLLGEPLVRISTRCLAPYQSPRLAACAALSDHWMPVERFWEDDDA